MHGRGEKYLKIPSRSEHAQQEEIKKPVIVSSQSLTLRSCNLSALRDKIVAYQIVSFISSVGGEKEVRAAKTGSDLRIAHAGRAYHSQTIEKGKCSSP